MIELIQSDTFRHWIASLRDHRARALIAARLLRLTSGMAGDTSLIGSSIRELRIHFGPGYRIYYIQDSLTIVVLLCGGEKVRRNAILRPHGGLRANGETNMTEQFSVFDPADVLDSVAAIEVFVGDAFETGDAAHIAAALGVVARAKGMTDLAARTGLSREQLYRSLSSNGNPTLKTTLAVLRAFGVSLTVTPNPIGLASPNGATNR